MHWFAEFTSGKITARFCCAVIWGWPLPGGGHAAPASVAAGTKSETATSATIMTFPQSPGEL